MVRRPSATFIKRFNETVESLELFFMSLTLASTFCLILIVIVNRWIYEGW